MMSRRSPAPASIATGKRTPAARRRRSSASSVTRKDDGRPAGSTTEVRFSRFTAAASDSSAPLAWRAVGFRHRPLAGAVDRMNEMVHRPRVVRVPLVDSQEDLGGPVGVHAGNRVARRDGQVRRHRMRPLRDRSGTRRTPFPRPVPSGGCATSNLTLPARERTPRPPRRRAVPARSAAEGPWPSAPHPIPAGALRAPAASARAAETASSRRPNVPSRIAGRSS